MDTGREQDQSIKDRKRLLYEDDAPPPAAAGAPRKPFVQHLRETPAAPLPIWVQAALWGAGVIVALLMLGAVMKAPKPKHTPRARVEAAQRPAVAGRVG